MYKEFVKACEKIKKEMSTDFFLDNPDSYLETQKRAIVGFKEEVDYYKRQVSKILDKEKMTGTKYPSWYQSLADAIFHEIWGYGGMAEWFESSWSNSSSAKIIGSRIYFMKDGQMILMPQSISLEKREQITRSFLLLTPEERLDKDFHEIYLLDGTRVTIFKGSLVKKGEDVIIFRRYIIPNFTFEEQAERGTIPKNSIGLFESMVDIGFNVAFCGSVRSAKTTFLSTWQSYEKSNLEGVMVETDPEIPLHKILPASPIIQIIADNDSLKRISKNLLRSDADYFVMAEARDGYALDTAVRMARKGTRRVKITFHTANPEFFVNDVAIEILRSMGDNPKETEIRVAASFDYIFHFIQLKDKNQKRLKSIYELGLDQENKKYMNKICNYDFASDSWSWQYILSKDKEEIGLEESPSALNTFKKELKGLAQ